MVYVGCVMCDQQFRGLCRVAIARIYAIQYSAEGKRKSMVYIGCVSSVQWIMGNVVLGDYNR